MARAVTSTVILVIAQFSSYDFASNHVVNFTTSSLQEMSLIKLGEL